MFYVHVDFPNVDRNQSTWFQEQGYREVNEYLHANSLDVDDGKNNEIITM